MQPESLAQLKKKSETLTGEKFVESLTQTAMTMAVQQQEQGETDATVQDVRKTYSLLSSIKERFSPAAAKDHADGTPDQPIAAKKQTYKERKEEKRKAEEKAAKEAEIVQRVSREAGGPVGIETYHIRTSLLDLYGKQANSAAYFENDEARELIHQHHVDFRVLHSFLNGYKKKEDGEPATEEDARKMQEDRTFIDDYISGDLERRRPHLERITNELLSAQITADMFSKEYVSQHAADMKVLFDRMVYFENMRHDPINAPFFEQLEPLQKELIEYRIDNLYRECGSLLTTVCMGECVMLSSGEYMDEPQSARKNAAVLLPGLYNSLINKLSESKLKEAQLFEKYQAAALRKSMEKGKPEAPDLSGKMDEASMQRFRDAFGNGQDGKTLDESNKAYREAKRKALEANPEHPKISTASAKLKLGLRTDVNEASKANKALRGTLMNAMDDELFALFVSMYDDKTDFSSMLPLQTDLSLVKFGSPARIHFGGGMEAVSKTMLEMVEKHLETDAFIDYYKASYDAYGSAEFLENSVENFVAFVTQSVLNNLLVGLNRRFGHHIQSVEGQDGSHPSSDFVTNATQNVLGICRLVEIKDEPEIAELLANNPMMTELTEQYSAIVAKLTSKLAPHIQK